MIRILAFLAAALSLTAAAVQAAPDSDQPHMAVKYADLNLAGSDGIAVLYDRIKSASVRACAGVGDDRTLGGVNQNKACRDELVAEGVRGMNLNALTQLAAGSSATIEVAAH